MSRKKTKHNPDKLSKLLRSHLQALGLESVAEYHRWCDTHGFRAKLDKSCHELNRERKFAAEAAISQTLADGRQRNKLPALFREIYAGQVSPEDISAPHSREIAEALAPNRDRRARGRIDREDLLQLLNVLHQRRVKILSEEPVLPQLGQAYGNTLPEAILRIAAHRRWWLRDPDSWKPTTRSHTPRRQMASLLRHLFVEYHMPGPMDCAWFADLQERGLGIDWIAWYIHIGQGKNIRDCDLPIPYTKKMAHHFMQAPADCTIWQALRWGQVRGMGGSKALAKAIMGSTLGNGPHHVAGWSHDFWITVIRWLIDQSRLDLVDVGPIVDFLKNQRFDPVLLPEVEGAPAPEPPQPNLTMKGRRLETLLRQVRQWHDNLARLTPVGNREWTGTGLPGLDLSQGQANSATSRQWTIRELCSGKHLVAEGRRMGHCVATYIEPCAAGQTSIWTLEVKASGQSSKRVTIEVRPQAKLICQARGRHNRLPSEEEQTIIHHWAQQSGLRVAPYACLDV